MDYSIVRKIAADFFKVDRPIGRRAPVLTFACDNSRSVLYHGKYYSPLVDTIEDELAARGTECLSVARITSSIKGDLSYGDVYAPEGGFARALVFKRLQGLLSRGRYPFSRAEERIWGRILDATGARKVVAIQPSRELCTVCRKRNIWVCDLQHGVVAEMHPWYGERFRGNEPLEYLPHAFLCWDHGSERVIGKWALAKGLDVKVIGHPWVARFRDPAPGDQLVRELSESYAHSINGTPRIRSILVSLSWGNYDIPNGIIPDGLRDAIVASAGRYRWLLRLHPNQLQGFATDEGARFFKYFDRSLSGYADWKIATYAALPAVLKDVDLHISWNSSVAIEAAHMGVKSALLSPILRRDGPVAEYFSYHREIGMVDALTPSSGDILEWIDRNIDSKGARTEFADSDAAFGQLVNFLSR